MDQIRQRLAEIDKQLARNPANYLNQTIAAAPLVFCAVGMIAGIVIQDFLSLPLWVWLLFLGICTAILVLSLTAGLERIYAIACITLVSFACAGAIRLASFNKSTPNDIRNLVGDEPTLATARGVIETQPYTDSNNWQFARFAHRDPGCSFYLRITEVETIDGWAKSSGVVRARVNEPVLDLKPGDYIQIYCRLNRFTGATNPGEFDTAKYLARKGVFVGATVESRDAIEPLEPGNTGLFTRIRAALQGFAIQTLLGGPYPKDEEDGLLLALVLGHRANIDPDTTEAFRRTGLLHFICLSGMNFGMVIWFVWWVCKTAGLMKPARAIVCMLSAILFLLVVPDNAPAFRAAVMCFAFCGAFIFRRNSNPFNSLALAAIVLLFISPSGLFEPGWQLTFASVLGILLLQKPIEFFLHEKVPGWLSSAFSVSLSAWLASAGILLYHFYAFQWLTSVWTVLVSPLIALISILGYLKLLVALLLPSAGDAMGVIINILSAVLIKVVRAIADLNISEILLGKTSIWVILGYYALIVYAGFFHLRHQLIKKTVCATAIILLVSLVLLPRWQESHRRSVTITVLNIGHGQALLAQLPGKTNVLFDTGSLSRDDVGTRVVIPFLRYNALGKIDAIVISHADSDHINGIPEVVGNNRAKSVYASNVFLHDERPTVKFLKQFIEVNDINELPKTLGATSIKLLWPDKDILENDRVSNNDKSIVTMIEYAGRKILITSDVQNFAQKEILRLNPGLKADVLIAPHHGSVKTLEREFLEAIQPQVVICSCTNSAFEKGQVIGQNNNFASYYTGRDGATTIRISEDGIVETTSFKIK